MVQSIYSICIVYQQESRCTATLLVLIDGSVHLFYLYCLPARIKMYCHIAGTNRWFSPFILFVLFTSKNQMYYHIVGTNRWFSSFILFVLFTSKNQDVLLHCWYKQTVQSISSICIVYLQESRSTATLLVQISNIKFFLKSESIASFIQFSLVKLEGQVRITG